MKPELQRVAIAEACGWKAIRMSRMWELSDDPSCPQDLCGRHPIHDAWSHLPDFLNDLNACHEMEKVLDGLPFREGWQKYEYELLKLVGHESFSIWAVKAMIHATAAQRAEAFLRALNLWKDET